MSTRAVHHGGESPPRPKRTAEALRLSEERLHLAMDVARMGAWDWNFKTDVVQADHAIGLMFGGATSQDLHLEAQFRKFIHPEDQPKVNRAIAAAVNGNGNYHAIFRVVWQDGTVRWLEGKGRVFHEANRQPIRMIGVTHDITERVVAEEILRRSEQQYADLVNNIDGIVWEAEAQSLQMTFVSYRAERMLGYPNREWIQSRTFWQDHLHPDDRQKTVSYSQACAARGEAHDFEYRMIAADGREVWIQDLVSVVMANGQPVILRGVMFDITKRKHAEEHAKQSARRLKWISRRLIEVQEAERRHLARELHDEVGQTLTATKLLLEGLRHQTEGALENGANLPSPSAQPKLIAEAISQVDHMLKLVRNLSLNLRPPMLDDFGLVSGLRWLFDQHARTTHRTVEFDPSQFTAKPDSVIETACFRIAQETLTNITRHSGAHKVSIILSDTEPGFHLLVRDDGMGFNAAAAQQSARNGGSLGLLSMRERAALVGGKIEIRSEIGKGTEVHAWFPLGAATTSNDFKP